MNLSLSLCALALAGASEAPAAETVSIELAFKPYKDWTLLLPDEQFAKVGEGIAFPHAGGEHFTAKLEGTVLWVDRDGDGECEAKVEPLEGGETALMVLRAENEEGADRSYAIRLSSDGAWSYSASGAMVGQLAGSRIQLVDQNNNGRFDDYGADAMIVGRGRAAAFLSRVVNVDGELYRLDVTSDGTRIDATPFTGESGMLDLGSDLETKARMRSVVLVGEDGETSFEVSRSCSDRKAKGFKLPAGSYTLHSGQVALGKGHAELRGGRMKPVKVSAGQTTELSWGGPVRAEFAYRQSGDEVQIGPGDIRYYGRAGEEYSNFMPLGSSPDFAIKDKKTGEVLVNAKFPGNC